MTKPAFAWSKYQSRIIEYGAAFFDPDVPETPKEHVAVDACAGSGKSTVLEGLVVRVLQVDPSTRVASLAFNTKITNATRARLQKAGVVGVDVKGLHSLGKSALDYRWGRTTVNKDKGFTLAKRIVPEAFGYDARQCVLRLARLAMAHVVEDDAALQELMFDYDIAPVDAPPEHVVGWAQKYLAAMREKSAEIDFDQMIYVPAYFKMKTPFYHLVLVDEVQDMNNAQLIIAKGAIREGGHIVVVGDPNQAIYRFRGAGVDSFNQVVRELDADVLPLSVSYRCPVNVVLEAQKFVPSIEPSPYAKPGTVERLPDAAMLKQWKPGDFVLSRANAPLMKYCLTALAAGVPAYIEGKNVGKGLLGLIQKSGEFSLPGFVKWLGAWRDEQVAKAEAAEKPDAVEEICDRFDVMTGLVEAATSLDDLRQRIGVLFEGDDNDQQPIEERAAGRVMFSSVHRAKGAETDGTVWLLDWTFRPGKNREEDNLCYVAITRAKDRLVFVTESQFFEKTKKKEYEASA